MNTSRIASMVAAASGVVGVVSAWLSWTVSGSAERNSYASLRAAQRLGIEQLTPFRVVWFLVPIAVLATVALLTAGLRRSAGAVGLVTGVVLAAFGGVVATTPVAAGMGPWLAFSAGVATAGASVVLIAQGGNRS